MVLKFLLTEKQIENILTSGLEYGANNGWNWREFNCFKENTG